MHELVPGARVEGRIVLGDEEIYGAGVDPVLVRRRIGMVFQKANPFPTMSIFENVAAGLTLAGQRNRRKLEAVVEQSLRAAALWDEVEDRLQKPGTSLSGGQQQRLCIARALAVSPEVLLMDEPASALDPASTLRIEELARELAKDITIVIVTHNMQQAARVSDLTGFFLDGELIEFGSTNELFTRPTDRRTEDYITGRFG
jgi:phosphate transport system ATP-binding protein